MKKLIITSFSILITMLYSISTLSQELLQNWEITSLPSGLIFHDIYFPNAENGTAVATNQIGNTVLYKSTNKGQNWSLNKNFNNSGATFASMDFANPGEGIVLAIDNGDNKVFKTENGGANWNYVFTIPNVIVNPKIRLVNSIIYSFSYGKDKLYAFDEPVIDLNSVNFCLTNLKFNRESGHGYAAGYSLIAGIYRPIVAHFDDGAFDQFIFDGTSDPYEVGGIFDIDMVPNSEVGYIAGLTTKGLVRGAIDYLFITTEIYTGSIKLFPNVNSNIKITSHNPGGSVLNGGIIKIGDYIHSTTNAGDYWVGETYGGDLSQFQDFQSSEDVAYILGNNGTTLLRRKVKTDIYTKFDLSNLSGAGSISIGGYSFNTPSNPFLRGGYSALFAPLSLNSGQQIFYNWDSDNTMSQTNNIYFSAIGTEIIANYKSKQISTNSSAIANFS